MTLSILGKGVGGVERIDMNEWKMDERKEMR